MTDHLNNLPSRYDQQPERAHLRIGYLPLTDSAPLIVASMLELGRRHGLTLELCRQPSWAAVRDNLLCGELDAAQSLYGMVYGVQFGLGGPQADMAILMTINRNGQAITVSNQLADAIAGGLSVRSALKALGRKPVLAQTFPTGTHAMWLNTWLASQDVHPLDEIESVVIPPPQMAEALLHGELDGFCCGEPWHAVAQAKLAGRTIVRSGDIWPNHPEKALACRRDFAALFPNTARALICTMLDACQWLNSAANRRKAAEWMALPQFLNLPENLIASTLPGDASAVATPPLHTPISFFDDAGLNAPIASDGLWFLNQFSRWGMLAATAAADDWDAIVVQVSQTRLYNDAVLALEIGRNPSAPGAFR